MSRRDVAKSKLCNKLSYRISLLADRVNEKSLRSRHHGNRNAWEAGSRTHVQNLGALIHVKTVGHKRKQRVDEVERDGLGRIGDSCQVHDLVLLDDKTKVGDKHLCLFLCEGNAKLRELVNQLLDKMLVHRHSVLTRIHVSEEIVTEKGRALNMLSLESPL